MNDMKINPSARSCRHEQHSKREKLERERRFFHRDIPHNEFYERRETLSKSGNREVY